MTLNPIDADPKLRQCPACGNQTPIENSQCVHCGAGSIDAVADHQKAASEQQFLQALFTRSNPFTMIFIGINVGVFVLMCLAGGFAVTSVDPLVLLGFGAKQNNLIAEHHEYWRLITSIFIHIGIIHLLLNNYALWIIGQEIERIYGSARFVILYLATGIVGSVGSYVFNPQATSAGASGAIFGLFGIMAAFAFRYRKEIPEFLSREIKRRVIPIILINLIFGFSVRIVDNSAHIGGLLSGIALALVVPYMRPHERITPLVWRTLQVICLAVILISFVDAFRGYSGPRLSLSNLTSRPGSSVETYFNNMRDANRSLVQSSKALAPLLKGGNKSGDVKPATDAVERGIRYVNSVPRINDEAEQYRKRLLDLLGEQKTILTEFEQGNPKDVSTIDEQVDSLVARYNLFVSDYSKWLPGFLKEHGYELNSGDH
jgi:membrane associated rhomboid family serine protease